MTKMAHGPSLPQARASSSNTNNNSDSDTTDSQQHQHNHRHLHSHIRARHHHHHTGDTDKLNTNHIPSRNEQQQDQPQQRDVGDLESNLITEVVQTVSVVQVVDDSGSPIEQKTYFPQDATAQTESPDTGITAAAGSPDTAEPTAALPSSDDALPSETAAEQSTASTTLPSDSSSLTSDPSSTFTSFPSLSGVHNSTSGPSFSNSTSFHSLSANKTATATIHSNTSFSLFGISTTTSSSSSTLLTSISEVPTITVTGDGTGVGGGVGAAGGIGATLTASSSSAPTDSNPSDGTLDPTTRSVIGGVVGGLSGIALVVLAVFIAVKWKRRQGQRIQLLADGPDNGRLSVFSRSGPGGSGPGGARGSWAVPAALASLTGYKRASQTSIQTPETSEKGFYRVSGRKLTSVLQSGGDGYGEPTESTDMRASTISGTSFYRPDSIAFFTDPKSSPLQLGSPMRPESGIMVMRSGPARTPVHEQGPIFDDTGPGPGPLTPPLASAAQQDPLGRSLLNQSGSGGVASSSGSPSRFTERIA